MEPVAIGDLRSEYYDANSDFPGLWELDENRCGFSQQFFYPHLV